MSSIQSMVIYLKISLNKQHHVILNIWWLFVDYIFRGGLNLAMSVWIARYFGPEQFGTLNYIIAVSFLFSSVATFGMNNIVVREVLRTPELKDAVLGSAAAVQIVGGTIAWLLATATIFFVQDSGSELFWMVALLSMVSVFRATEVVKFWFESLVLSRYVVWAENVVFIIFSAVKTILIVYCATLGTFVWVLWGEGVCIAGALLWVYSRYGGRLRQWQCNWGQWWQLIRAGTPLMISGLAIAGYMRIDQIMLGKLFNEQAVGIFSAALRLSEAWYFIPVSIMASLFPAVLSAKSASQSQYIERLESTHTLMVLIALLLAIPITFCSDHIINLLYGDHYSGAGAVLALHIWSGLFVFIGVASHQWFVAENLQRFVLLRTICGALVNVFLNLFLIPLYGPVGAAVASLIAHGLVNVFLNVITKATRPIFWLQLKSLLLIPLWNGTLFRQIGKV